MGNFVYAKFGLDMISCSDEVFSQVTHLYDLYMQDFFEDRSPPRLFFMLRDRRITQQERGDHLGRGKILPVGAVEAESPWMWYAPDGKIKNSRI